MHRELNKYFVTEAKELLEQLGKETLELDKACSPAQVARLLRYAHTLKGAARVVGQLRIAEAAHQFEEILAPHRDRALALPSSDVDALLALLDGAAPLVDAIDLSAVPARAKGEPARSSDAAAAPSAVSGKEPALAPSPVTTPRLQPAGTAATSPASPRLPATPLARPRPALDMASARSATQSPVLRSAAAPSDAALAPFTAQQGATAAVLAPLPEPAAPASEAPPELRDLPPALRGADASNRAAPPQPSAASPAARPQEHRTVRAEMVEVDEVVEGVTAALAEIGSLNAFTDKLDELRHLADLCTRQLLTPRKLDPRAQERTLEHARALSEQMSGTCRGLEVQLAASLGRARRELEGARSHADQLRLSPVSMLFTVLERAVREAARSLDKPVRVETRGREIRLDGSVVEVVQAAFLHVVRNAVTHGIESPERRKAAGKPATGTIEIEVRREGRRVAFSCRDDGGGFDVEKVKNALVRAGKLDPRTAEEHPERVLSQLLGSGVSTAESITALSGRGVGMDVLREAAERLSGTVRLDSQPGRGVLAELSVPLSIAALEALAVECDGQRANLPLDAVRRSLRLQDSEVAQTATGQSVVHQGEVIPFLPLAHALRNRARERARGKLTAVIVRCASGSVALGVDRVIGARTVVLRKLPAMLPRSPLLAGAALDALGNPELVLDPDALLAEARRHAPTMPEAAATLPILIVDDSLTTRMLEQNILESAGYRVALASSAEEGLVQARANKHGLFLVDVEMPGMDGFGFIETVRSDPLLAHVPAVLVSSRDSPEDFARGREAGANGYVVKGHFDQRELLTLIGTLLGKS